MSKIRVTRHNHYTKWALPKEWPESPYPAEDALVAHIRATQSQLFTPYPFAYSENNEYHYHLAFLVEAVELFPLKVDLSFDALWRAFESFWKNCVIAPNVYKLNQEAPVLAQRIDSQVEYNSVIDDFVGIIPVQSCEYLIQRIFAHWPPLKGDSRLIWNRLNNPPNMHTTVTDLLTRIAGKYPPHNHSIGDRRKAAMLLRLAIRGTEVDVGGIKVLLPRAERISFLINALLYTFRNDRFHGNVQPPFKSSLGRLRTYAHAHYCFAWAHFLFMFSATQSTPAFVEHQKLAENTIENLAIFSDFYGSHILA